MGNTKKTPIHLVRVLEDRWFAWTIVLTVVILVALSAYVTFNNYSIDRDMEYSTVKHDRGTLYRDAYLGFSVKHPVTWAIEAEKRNIITLVDPKNYGESITVSVLDPADKNSVIKALPVASSYDIAVSGETVKFYNLKTDKNTDKFAVVLEKNEKLFLIKGNSQNIQEFLSTFRVIPPVTQ
ncbi:MAG: hypothetical protein ACM3KM_02470 [Acidobacteriaceae bacterium]